MRSYNASFLVPGKELAMNKNYQAAVVVDRNDWMQIYDEILVASSFWPHQVIVDKETPDENYRCIYWDTICWDRPEVNPLRFKLEKIRHAVITVDEECHIEKDFKSWDDRGTDEEFDIILSPQVSINFWNDTDVGKVKDFVACADPADLRALLPSGTKVEMLHSADFYNPPSQGTRGVVDYIDDADTVHVNWETGSTLGVVPGVDKIRITEEV